MQDPSRLLWVRADTVDSVLSEALGLRPTTVMHRLTRASEREGADTHVNGCMQTLHKHSQMNILAGVKLNM